ncbi:thioredoxin family protein [Solihabitans fulvus]|uniref:Thioredoxin family protein n=1 Tax=Solihabitans fulvus TaxID=1892852 RepID=A0A5B2XCM6_9PSEU|nr:thioredoxin family protein [Solihabitans fulvus]KAA2261043.1 thioredoxin family protein [Solihabitans fulvus]
MTGLLVLVGTLVLAVPLGFALRARDGRISRRAESDLPAEVLRVVDPANPITLVQLTTTFCAQCPQARTLLRDVAAHTDGVTHAEFDLTDHPGIATRLGVLRTPTTLVVNSSGTELLRVGGVPKRASMLAALEPHLPA